MLSGWRDEISASNQYFHTHYIPTDNEFVSQLWEIIVLFSNAKMGLWYWQRQSFLFYYFRLRDKSKLNSLISNILATIYSRSKIFMLVLWQILFSRTFKNYKTLEIFLRRTLRAQDMMGSNLIMGAELNPDYTFLSQKRAVLKENHQQ